MFTRILLSLILTGSLCFNIALYPCAYGQEPASMTIKGSDGKSVSFPLFMGYISHALQHPEKLTIPKQPMDQRLLEQFKTYIEHLPTAARDTNGKTVKTARIRGNTIFVHSLVREAIAQDIASLNLEQLISLLHTATYFTIKPLQDAFSEQIAMKICSRPLHFNQILDKVEELHKLPHCVPLDEEQLKQISKYLYLLCAHQKEYTVEDYLGLHGQPIINNGVSLCRKKLTSLVGIHRIQHGESIRYFFLNHNFILGSDIDPDFPIQPFRCFPNLKVLSLEHNRLDPLPEDLLNGLTQLERLNLNHNHLRRLPKNLLQGMATLKHLSISRNRLKKLPDNLLQETPDLHSLYLSGNQLTSLSKGLFKESKIGILDLTLNRLPEDLDSFINHLELTEDKVSFHYFPQKKPAL